MTSNMQHVLGILATYSDDLQGALSDSQLQETLEPFRESRPRRLCCPKQGCHGKLVWIAISPYEARVLGSPSGPITDEMLAANRKRVTVEIPEGRPRWSIESVPLFRNWSVAPNWGIDVGAPFDAVPMKECLRWVLTCGRKHCQTRYMATNTELLTLLVQAHVTGPGDVTLPAACELTPSRERSLHSQSW